MDHQFIALSANDEQTETIAIFKNNSRFALPVINESGVLLGIVTSDDVLRLAEKENTREIQRIGGSEALEEPYTYDLLWASREKKCRLAGYSIPG